MSGRYIPFNTRIREDQKHLIDDVAHERRSTVQSCVEEALDQWLGGAAGPSSLGKLPMSERAKLEAFATGLMRRDAKALLLLQMLEVFIGDWNANQRADGTTDKPKALATVGGREKGKGG